MSIPEGSLEVHLEFASGLRIGNFRIGGLIDLKWNDYDTLSQKGIGSPYAVISCGPNQHVKSRTAEGQGSRPVFNETYTFRVDESIAELAIWMYNKRTFKNDDELGWIRIPFANLFHGGAGIIKLPSSSYPITSQTSGQCEGELRLSLAFTPRSQGHAHGYGGHDYPNSAGGSQGFHPSRGRTDSHHAAPPTSNPGPFIPSFRSNQGRRTEAELREIAANALDIDIHDWIKLCAKMDVEDSIRLEDHLISPEVMKKLEARTAQMPPAALQQLLVQFDASDMARVQTLSARAETKKAAENGSYPSRSEADMLEQQQRTISAMQMATRMADARTRAAAESGDRMNCIGTGYHMVRIDRTSRNYAWDMNDI